MEGRGEDRACRSGERPGRARGRDGAAAAPPADEERAHRRLLLPEEEVADVTVFESVYLRFGRLIYTCPTLIVEGRLERRGGYLSVLAERLWPFPDDLRPVKPHASRQPLSDGELWVGIPLDTPRSLAQDTLAGSSFV